MLMLYLATTFVVFGSVSAACSNEMCDNKGAGVIASYFEISGTDCMNACNTSSSCVGYYYSALMLTCTQYASYSGISTSIYNLKACVPELWSSWVDFGCSVTCAQGTRTKKQYCCGTTCPQSSISQTTVCDTGRICPIHGGWSPWSSFGPCSVTCGTGVRTRTRLCDNPTPAHGGLYCPWSSTNTQQCVTAPCSVDGGWSGWSSFGKCSTWCGSGVRIRTRQCDNPQPMYGGLPCAGPDAESQHCDGSCDGLYIWKEVPVWDDAVSTSPTTWIAEEDSVLSCTRRCIADESCETFFYRPDTHQCQGHGVTLSDQSGGYISVPGARYYKRHNI